MARFDPIMSVNLTKEDNLQRKKNLKWFHSRIEDFNNNVPYQVKALTGYRNNIRKQYRLGNVAAVRQERMTAERTVRSLKQLLTDVEELRQQVIDADLNKFDKLVNVSREGIRTALDTFNQYYDSLSLSNGLAKPAWEPRANDYPSIDDPSDDGEQQKQILMQVPDNRYLLEIAEEVERIESDSRILNEVYKDLGKIIHDQGEIIDRIEDQVEQSHAHVVSAEREIAQVASRMQGSVYPVVGAIIGSCVGGPIGFVAGLKVGAVVAVTGSVIGFSSGKVLKYRQQRQQKEISQNAMERKARDKKDAVTNGNV